MKNRVDFDLDSDFEFSYEEDEKFRRMKPVLRKMRRERDDRKSDAKSKFGRTGRMNSRAGHLKF